MINKDIIQKFADMLKEQFDQHGIEYTAYTIVDDVMKEMEDDLL